MKSHASLILVAAATAVLISIALSACQDTATGNTENAAVVVVTDYLARLQAGEGIRAGKGLWDEPVLAPHFRSVADWDVVDAMDGPHWRTVSVIVDHAAPSGVAIRQGWKFQVREVTRGGPWRISTAAPY